MRKSLSVIAAAALWAAGCPGVEASSATPADATPVVLYNQLSASYDTSTPIPSETSTDGGNSRAADDFTVDDADGWTVSGFTFAITYNLNLLGSTHLTYNLDVYPDAGGVPGDAPLCSVQDAEATPDATPPFANVTVSFPIPCKLAPGTYWASLQGNTNADATLIGSATMAVSDFTPATTPGAVPVWKSVAGTSGCGDWTPVSSCGWSDTALGFAVLGTAGGGLYDGLDFTLTVAPDNGDPDQCGTQREIETTVGDALNFCYTVTNHSGHPFAYHTLSDSIGGTLFSLQPYDLEDGQSYHFNRIVTAEQAYNGYVTAAWTANDDRLTGYDADDSGPSHFVDITATGTALGDIGNDGSRAVTVPFPVTYYGVQTTDLGISNNGAIVVTTTRPVDSVNTALPNVDAALSEPVMFPLWDDFDATSGGTYYATLGTAPNRRFVVEWASRPHYPGDQNSDTATFEVIFDEASGTFSFEYADVGYTANGDSSDPSATCNGGACATIGVQQDGSHYTQYSFDTASVSNGTSIVWQPRVVTPVTSQAAARLIVGAPVISVGPGALTGAAPTGGVATTLLTVANVGNRDLSWSVDTAASDIADPGAHFPAVPYVAPANRAPAAFGAAAQATTAAEASLGLSRSAAVSPFDAQNVPAYGIGGFGPDGGIHPAYDVFYGFDAADPSQLAGTSALPIQVWPGGAFINNDFNTEYVLNQGGGLFAFDTASGQDVFIGTGSATTAGYIASALAWDATTQTLYAAAWDPNSTPRVSYLYQVDPVAGTGVQVAAVTGARIAGLAFDATGHLYGLDGDADQLIALDKRNGVWAGIGPLGFELGGTPSIAFDPRTGVLWMAAHPIYNPALYPIPSIYTVDTGTGRATLVAPVVDYVDLTALALAVPYAGCSDASTIPWLSVTPGGGTLAGGDSARLSATFDASNLAAGTYTAQLCVRSDDLSNRIVAVPVTFTVTGSTQPPVALGDAYTATAGSTLQVGAPGVLGNDTDPAGHALTAVLVSGPAHGTLSLQANGSFTYTPADGYSGADSFSYVANDGSDESAPATVTLTVQPRIGGDAIFANGFDSAAP